jgi:hypothetical protein
MMVSMTPMFLATAIWLMCSGTPFGCEWRDAMEHNRPMIE